MKSTKDTMDTLFRCMGYQGARGCDIGIVAMMAKVDPDKALDDADDRKVVSDVLANFVWDHWLGEPEVPTLETVRQDVLLFISGDLPDAQAAEAT